MYIYEWDNDIVTGVEMIDQQHKEMYDRISAFFDATNRNRDEEVLDDMLHYLNGFFVEHFTDEEKVHQDGGFPDFDAHLQAHNQILRDLNEINSLYIEDGYTDMLELKLYNLLIRDMLVQMKQFDVPLARFIKEKSKQANLK